MALWYVQSLRYYLESYFICLHNFILSDLLYVLCSLVFMILFLVYCSLRNLWGLCRSAVILRVIFLLTFRGFRCHWVLLKAVKVKMSVSIYKPFWTQNIYLKSLKFHLIFFPHLVISMWQDESKFNWYKWFYRSLHFCAYFSPSFSHLDFLLSVHCGTQLWLCCPFNNKT